MATESNKERVDRELVELLNEVRVAIPGAQVLLAFLLGIAFTERFPSLTSLQRGVYFATLLSVAASIALLIAPTAYHRTNFRARDKERLLQTSTRMVLASLGLLLGAVTGAVFLVTDLLYGLGPSLLVGALTAAWFFWFWFVFPVVDRGASSDDDGGER